MQADEKRFEKANLLFTLLEAVGVEVPELCWLWLEEGPVAYEGIVPSVSAWRAFLKAMKAGDRPAALVQATRLMAAGGTAQVSPSLAGSVVAGLMALGLEAEARAIAVETLIAQGA